MCGLRVWTLVFLFFGFIFLTGGCWGLDFLVCSFRGFFSRNYCYFSHLSQEQSNCPHGIQLHSARKAFSKA